MIHIFSLSSRYIPYVRKNKRLDDALNYDARFLVGEVNAVHRYVPDSLRCMCVYVCVCVWEFDGCGCGCEMQTQTRARTREKRTSE